MIWQVLNQEETPFLYSVVFGEGVLNDATSVVLFNAIQRFDLSHITSTNVMQFIGNFLSLYFTSTVLGVAVSPSLSLSPPLCVFLSTLHMHVCLLIFPIVYTALLLLFKFNNVNSPFSFCVLTIGV